MSEETLRFIIEHWNSISVGLILFLFVIAVGVLFFTDRLISPKSIESLRAEKLAAIAEKKVIEAECASLEGSLKKAGAELADARVNYVRAEEKIGYYERDLVRMQREHEACQQRLQRIEIEEELRERLTRDRSPRPEPET